MFLKRLGVGFLSTNCYIVAEDKKDKLGEKSLPDGKVPGMVIDPGDDGELIEQIIKDNNIELKYIVLTHGHFDHIGAVDCLKQKFKAEVMVHRLDAEMVSDPKKNMSVMFAGKSMSVKPDRLLEDGDVIQLGDLSFKVLHTPGHSLGGICLLSENVLFSGDTLFQGTVGRTDGPGGSMEIMRNSIRTKLVLLNESCSVYPGHGDSTTIGEEKMTNPFMRKL